MSLEDKSKEDLLAEIEKLQSQVKELEMAAAEHERVSEALKNEQRLLSALMNNLPDRIYFKDRESRFTRVSKALAKMHGLEDPAESIGLTDFDFFTDEHAQPAFETEQNILKSDVGINGLVERETWGSGRVTWVKTTKLPLHDDDGEVIGTFGISSDITELKEVQDALKDSEAIYHSLVDNLSQNVYSKDKEGHLTAVNSAYCKTLGLTREELLGKTDFDLFPEELADKYLKDDLKVIESGEVLECVEEHQTKDRGRIYVHVVKSPKKDANGNVIGTQGIFWDVTEKTRNDEALKLFAAIVESSDDGIIATTKKGKILSWNRGAEMIYGYTPEEAIGEKIDFLIPPGKDHEKQAFIDHILKGESLRHYKTTRLTKEKEEIDVSLTLFPIRTGSGDVIGIAGITRDISDALQAESAASQLDAISNISKEGILHLDQNGNILDCNVAAESFFALDKDTLSAQPFSAHLTDDSQNAWYGILGSSLQGEVSHDVEMQLKSKSDAPLKVLASVSPVTESESEKITGMTVVIHQD